MSKVKSSLFILFLILIGCMTLKSCKDDKKVNDIPTQGKAIAYINGEIWGGEVTVIERYGKLTLLMDKYKEVFGANVPWETLSFHLVGSKTDSTQRVFDSDSVLSVAPWLATKTYGAFSTSRSDGDVTCDFYRVIKTDSVNNWIRIDGQSDNFNKAWGSFSVHLYRTQTCEYTRFSDTLMITNGKFSFEK